MLAKGLHRRAIGGAALLAWGPREGCSVRLRCRLELSKHTVRLITLGPAASIGISGYITLFLGGGVEHFSPGGEPATILSHSSMRCHFY
jgi:hypothetical protein